MSHTDTADPSRKLSTGRWYRLQHRQTQQSLQAFRNNEGQIVLDDGQHIRTVPQIPRQYAVCEAL